MQTNEALPTGDDPRMDVLNQAVFDSYVDLFDQLTGWTDPGEEKAFEAISRAARGARILDVGVGAGRTTPLLLALSDRYVAIDFVPTMVERCRASHPGVDVRIGDARNLAAFDDESFDLVVFSYNGLDAISHADRARALSELTRVLSRQGTLLFSTLNRDYKGHDQPPWRSVRMRRLERTSLRDVAHWFTRAPRRVPFYVRCYHNWWRNHRLSTVGEDWSTGTLSVHEYGLLVHFTTIDGLRREIAAAGLTIAQIFANSGEPIDPASERCEVDYFHVIAHRIE